VGESNRGRNPLPNVASARLQVRKPTAISLFAGCGGSDAALVARGFEIVWANDIWELACETYRTNIPRAQIAQGDICRFREFPTADLLVGCYPCQGYSQGGRRDPNAPINYLYREFDRVLRQVRPKAFVVENVIGMAYGRNFTLLAAQLHRYRSAGYKIVWQVLDAKDYGVPQSRRRIFIVGISSDIELTYKFPKPSHGPNGSYRYVSQRDAIGHLPRWPDEGFCSEPLHWYYLSRNRRHEWNEPSPCVVGHWRHVPLHPASPALRRLGPNKWTFSKSGRARRLAYTECALLQGFPKNWRWEHGSIRDRFQLIGNAVPPLLFEAVVAALSPIWD
jgi:DNA (cytosine-5)-methyltransferase 1